MYSVLIADDELAFRRALAMSVDWTSLGLNICAQAVNGAQALELARKHQPDIILADINMPILNGLDFIEAIKKELPQVRVIIISGHDEFAFAVRAIHLAADAYLLKPVNEQELVKTLENMVNAIENSREQLDEQSHLRYVNVKHTKLKQLHFVQDVALGNISRDAISAECKRHDFPLQSNFLMIASEIFLERSNIWRDSETELARFALKNVTEEIFCDFSLLSFSAGPSTLYSLLYRDSEFKLEEVKRLCERLCILMREHVNLQIAVGISSLGNFSEQIPDLMVQADYSERYNRFFGKNDIAEFDNDFTVETSALRLLSLKRTDLLMHLRRGEGDEVSRYINQLVNEHVLSLNSYDNLFSVAFFVISTLIEYANEYNLRVAPLYEAQRHHQSILMKFKKAEDAVEYLSELAEQSMAAVNTGGTLSLHAQKAQEYILKHYSDSGLRLEDIARATYVNSSYLSNVFTGSFGVSVIEYLTGVRLAKAKDLLDEGCYSIHEIAEKVGYLDPNYFSKCFKKKYDKTPKEYLKLQNRRTNFNDI